MQKITPFLWFDGQAETAAKFYCSVFKKSKIIDKALNTEGTPGEPGSVLTVRFRILGEEFVALNGGPQFKFNQSISFVVYCDTQKEIDYYWKKLTGGGGKPVACGWLEDKYGLSWQIVPTALFKLITSKDTARTTRVMQALMDMVKLDLKKLQQAAAKK